MPSPSCRVHDVFGTYKSRIVGKDPRSLHILSEIARPMRQSHVDNLVNDILRRGYRVEFGYVSWTRNRTRNKDIIINGMHRVSALNKIVDSPSAPSTLKSDLGHLPLLEFYSEDGEDIPLSDLIIMSDSSNDGTSLVAIPSIGDKMRAVVSFLQQDRQYNDMPISLIAITMHRRGLLRGYEPRHIQRFAKIAMTLSRRPLLMQCFMGYADQDLNPKAKAPGGMALSTLQSDVFHASQEEVQVLMLDCLHAHHNYHSVKQTHRTASLASPVDAAFFTRITGIADVLRHLGQRRGMTLRQVLNFNVTFQGSSHTAGGSIANVMKRSAYNRPSPQKPVLSTD